MLRLSEAQGPKQKPFPKSCLQQTCVRSELQSSSAVAKGIAWRQHFTPGCVQSEQTYRRKIRYADFWMQVFICQANGKLGLLNLSPQFPYLPAKEKLCARTGALTLHVFQNVDCFSLTKMLRLEPSNLVQPIFFGV